MRALILALVASCILACQARPPAVGGDVLARVNGRPIHAAELLPKIHGDEPPGKPTPDRLAQALEVAIDQELAAQRALALGLTVDGEAQEEIRALQERVEALTRRELARAFHARWPGKAQVTQAEARRYFDENASRVRTDVKVAQILKRGRTAIEEVAARLRLGTPFEEVAACQFSAVPDGQRPWELGYLTWQQIPAIWWPELDRLSIGGVSEVISGPADRYWVLQLLDRRRSEASFESLAPAIIAKLSAEKDESARVEVAATLRKGAHIERFVATPSVATW